MASYTVINDLPSTENTDDELDAVTVLDEDVDDADVEESDQETLLSSHSVSYDEESYLEYAPKSSTRWIWLRTLYWCLHLILLVPAIYGWQCAVNVHRGIYVRTPVYSDTELAQAGWSRPALRNGTRSIATIFPSSSAGNTTTVKIEDMQSTTASELPDDQHILILTPMRNAEGSLPSFFRLLESLQHPKQNTSVGFLVGDEEDGTVPGLLDWIAIQERRAQYRRITLLKKDLDMLSPSGDVRHRNWIQAQRRKLMAKARTLLLTSTLRPDVDWIFWLDSDVAEAPPTVIRDLLQFSQKNGTIADVITPNTARRKKDDRLHGYDLNNWQETSKSIAMKAKLSADVVLHEGDRSRPTYRKHLTDLWVPPNITTSWARDSPIFSANNAVPHSYTTSNINTPRNDRSLDDSVPNNLYDPVSEAYIGKTVPLDAVGGVATLVNANIHRLGATFPSWVEDHQVETEGFGVMAKRINATIVGLPNYFVVHE